MVTASGSSVRMARANRLSCEFWPVTRRPIQDPSPRRKLAKLGYVPQEVTFPADATVQMILDAAAGSHEDAAARVPGVLGQAGFENGEAMVASLSGGWKRRVAIARELVKQPDLLLLDEPTNHLDLEGILWLERLLKAAPFASVVVSHDRYFLENVATEMAELARLYPGGLFRVKGSYSVCLERKNEFLSAQEREQQTLANKVRRELEWLRRGPKARATKAKARIDEAGRLIDELAEVSARRETGAAQIEFSASGRRTKNLLAARVVTKELGGRTLFRGLDLILRPGVRLGLAGANGSGKTTLLRILKGEILPDEGEVERAEKLRVVYFDQNRGQLDPAVTLRKALALEGDSVIYRDQPIHVAGWAKRFLFRAEQLETAVGELSGGEQARVLIAKLMLQPADVLLLDEPTNDLDITTLETLEESLLDFPGALVLVTHDRYLLDRVSTAVLGLNGEGGAQLFADYSQWEQAQMARRKPKPAALKPAPEVVSVNAGRKRLSYLDSREWESMEERILAAEEALESRMALVQQASADAMRLPAAYQSMLEAQEEVDRLYARWAELESKLS